jgi:hypothetical protein
MVTLGSHRWTQSQGNQKWHVPQRLVAGHSPSSVTSESHLHFFFSRNKDTRHLGWRLSIACDPENTTKPLCSSSENEVINAQLTKDRKGEIENYFKAFSSDKSCYKNKMIKWGLCISCSVKKMGTNIFFSSLILSTNDETGVLDSRPKLQGFYMSGLVIHPSMT